VVRWDSNPPSYCLESHVGVGGGGRDGVLHHRLLRPNRQRINLRNALPVAAFAMRTGEALLVTATRRPIKPAEKVQLRVARQKRTRATGRRGEHAGHR
jgi:hypothetical protein